MRFLERLSAARETDREPDRVSETLAAFIRGQGTRQRTRQRIREFGRMDAWNGCVEWMHGADPRSG
eukprot:11207836-Lingulodinium_polyedra.AAC.1